jgi:hypothetical protein
MSFASPNSTGAKATWWGPEGANGNGNGANGSSSSIQPGSAMRGELGIWGQGGDLGIWGQGEDLGILGQGDLGTGEGWSIAGQLAGVGWGFHMAAQQQWLVPVECCVLVWVLQPWTG